MENDRNREGHRTSVWTTDGELMMSCLPGEELGLNWSSYAILASELMECPVVPCDPSEDMFPHLIGPGVSWHESDLSLLWSWTPTCDEDMDELSSDMAYRVVSLAGRLTDLSLGPDFHHARVEGHPSLWISSLFDFDLRPTQVGVLHDFEEYSISKIALTELGYTTISSYWNERSRSPLEEVRDRIMQIASCEALITSCVAGMGIAHSMGIPYIYLDTETRPLSDRDAIPYDVQDFFSHACTENHVCTPDELLSLQSSHSVSKLNFHSPEPLEPQQAADIYLGHGIERFRDKLRSFLDSP